MSFRLLFAWHTQSVAVILASVIVREHGLWTGWVGVALIIIGIAVGQRRTSVTP